MGATLPVPKQWFPYQPTLIRSPKDILKPLSSEILKKIESLDLSVVTHNKTSYNDLNDFSQHGLPSSRSELSLSNHYSDLTSPRPYESGSAIGMARVTSDLSIYSPRDPLSVSNHSTGGGSSAFLSSIRSQQQGQQTFPFQSQQSIPVVSKQVVTPPPPGEYQIIRPPKDSPTHNSNMNYNTGSGNAFPAPFPAMSSSNLELSSFGTTSMQSNSPNQVIKQPTKGRPIIPLIPLQNLDKFQDPLNISNHSGGGGGAVGGGSGKNSSFAFGSGGGDGGYAISANRLTPRDMSSPLNSARTVDSDDSPLTNRSQKHFSQQQQLQQPASQQIDVYANVSTNPAVNFSHQQSLSSGSNFTNNPPGYPGDNSSNRMDSFDINWSPRQEFSNFNGRNNQFNPPSQYVNNSNTNYSSNDHYQQQQQHYNSGGGNGRGSGRKSYNNYQQPYNTARSNESNSSNPSQYYPGMNSARSDFNDNSNHGGGGGHRGFTPRQQQQSQYQQQNAYPPQMSIDQFNNYSSNNQQYPFNVPQNNQPGQQLFLGQGQWYNNNIPEDPLSLANNSGSFNSRQQQQHQYYQQPQQRNQQSQYQQNRSQSSQQQNQQQSSYQQWKQQY
jgi:hypothetical protein